MLLTRATEYALLTLDFIRNSDHPKGAEQIATELNFPKSFLAKILQSLAKNGILESKKGAHGGFIMAKTVSGHNCLGGYFGCGGEASNIFDCTQ